jgi:alcohol dehydrogenase class IV
MTDAPRGEFRAEPVPSVIFGAGSLERLPERVEALGAKRVLVVTLARLRRETDLVQRVEGLLGERCAGVFSGVAQHVPRACVVEGARAAREARADLLVSLGGSSAADAAKGVNLVLSESPEIDDFFERFDRAEFTLPGASRATEFRRPKLPYIAIPTTLSGGEFTASLGITDLGRRRKDNSADPKVTARVVILDPDVTVFTGRELWASTALKVLSDCFEEVCSPRRQPFVDALSLHAAHLVSQNLLPSLAEPPDMGARALLQHAAWMGLLGLGHTGLGLVAALRHQIGGGFGVPHGVASAVVFPHVMAFNRPVVEDRLRAIARALDLPGHGTSGAGRAAVQRVQELIRASGLPSRLRDVGVPHDGLDVIAEATMGSHQIRNNARPVSRAELGALLEEAW